MPMKYSSPQDEAIFLNEQLTHFTSLFFAITRTVQLENVSDLSEHLMAWIKWSMLAYSYKEHSEHQKSHTDTLHRPCNIHHDYSRHNQTALSPPPSY